MEKYGILKKKKEEEEEEEVQVILIYRSHDAYQRNVSERHDQQYEHKLSSTRLFVVHIKHH
jgi:hypothetical protein